ncbi:MAG: type II secretion system F family protein [Euryarchaeota archaeon]|nr:type II secretion system F family protein [Euryarchaeota archaeon]
MEKMTKSEMKKVAMAKKSDYTKLIIGVCAAVALILVVIAIMNFTDQVDYSFKKLNLYDKNHDGRIDRLDALQGHDNDGDGIPEQGESPTKRMVNFMVLAVIVLMGPYSFYKSKQLSDIEAIEKRLPEFLRDVAEAGRFGMTLADAIVVASSGRYGKLTEEIKKMAAQIEWGVTATEALRLFSKRINTPSVNRIVAIIAKASDAGGNVADVLTMVSHDAREAQMTFDERKIAMTTYLAVVYISYFVFLVTIIILNVTFLPKIREAGVGVAAASEAAGISGGMASLDVSVIPSIELSFFVSAIIHAVGDGIMAGVLQNGKISSGLRHSTIMLLLGFVILEVI